MTFHKYHKIKIVGDVDNKGIFEDPNDEIIIESKYDGANFRFMIKNGQIIFGSRTQQLSEDKEHQFQKNFQKCINHILEKFNDLDDKVKKSSNGKIFYGEDMVKHSINYNWEKIPPFLGFDVLDIKSGKYLDYKHKNSLFESWKLDIVPLVKICKSNKIGKIDDDLVPNSKYISPSSIDLKDEGVVFKNYSKQLFAKYVREKFKEKNREVFGTNKRFAKTDDEYFVAVYCTNPRIDKCLFKLLDEDKKLEMKLMGDLLNMVYKDIWEENWNEIAFSKKKIDLNNLKKLVSKRCLEVLKQSIINNTFK